MIGTSNKLVDNAEDYLAKHRIVELFEDLCSAICFKKPDNVQKFIVEELQIKKISGFKTGVFQKEEVENIFNLFDLKKDGYLGKQTCKDALKTFATNEYIFSEIDDEQIPERSDIDTFKLLCDKYFFSYTPALNQDKQKQLLQTIKRQQLTQEYLNQNCDKIFSIYDRDNTGFLAKNEFYNFVEQMLKSIGHNNPDPETINQVMKEMDLDQDERLSKEEFMAFVQDVLNSKSI